MFEAIKKLSWCLSILAILAVLTLTLLVSGEGSSYADLSSQITNCFAGIPECSAFLAAIGDTTSSCWVAVGGYGYEDSPLGHISLVGFSINYGIPGYGTLWPPGENCAQAWFITGGSPTTPAAPPHNSGCQNGSIIHVDNQAVGERVPIVGAPFDLVYFSDRVPGRVQAYTATVPFFDDGVMQVGGQVFSLNSTSSPLVWNGLDGSGNIVQGTQTATVGEDIVRGGGCFVLNNPDIAIFGCAGPACSTSYIACAVDQYTQTYTFNLGMYRTDLLGLGGWAPSILHFYDVNSKTLYLGDGTNRVVAPQYYGNGTQYIEGNSDGSELYVFSLSGNHLATLNGHTGATLYTFGYDSQNRLSTITDAYSNVTSVLRDASGNLTGIQAPYGQTTSLTLDSNGYLASITNPNGESYSITSYGTGGLMETFQKPAGQTSTFVFDSNGLLTSDSSSAGSSTALVNSGSSSSITTTSAMGFNTQYVLSSTPGYSLSYQRTQTDPDSGESLYYFSEDLGPAANTIEYSTPPDGTLYYQNTVADPRLGVIGSFLYEGALEPGSSVWYSLGSRTIPGWTQSSDPNNPTYFNYSTINTSVAVNGASASWSDVYTLSTGTDVMTSPVGRVRTTVTDTYGKPTSVQSASFTPITFGYDSHGRLIQINQGSARQSTINYYPSGAQAGWVSSVTDAMSETTSYTYDHAGRVLTETLPDSRVITYTYDADGNLASVTPPSSSTHTLNANGFDFLGSYIAPAIGTGLSTTTSYTYNNDKKLTGITRPDGNTVTLTYSSTTGNLTTVTDPDGNFT